MFSTSLYFQHIYNIFRCFIYIAARVYPTSYITLASHTDADAFLTFLRCQKQLVSEFLRMTRIGVKRGRELTNEKYKKAGSLIC